jgi:hypothetical protein
VTKNKEQKGFICVSERNICVSEGACAYFLLVSVVCYTGLHLGECMENHSVKATVRKLIIQLSNPGGLLYKAWVCNHLIAGILMLILIYLLTAVVLTPAGSSTVHIYKQTIHRTR